MKPTRQIKPCKNERALKKVLKSEGELAWVNLYGAPIKRVKQLKATGKLMNTFPDEVTDFLRSISDTRSLTPIVFFW